MPEEKIISGIQQIGIGVRDLRKAWRWYRDIFGVDVRIFEDASTAELMLPYTGGKPRKRHAVLTINMMGGGGFEIWQYIGREPKAPKEPIVLGDLGIFAAKIKCPDVEAAYQNFREKKVHVHELAKDPGGKHTFFLFDPFGNIFQVVDSNSWFSVDRSKETGAILGAVIGVSDIDESLKVYSDILGYDDVAYDEEGFFDDLKFLPGGNNAFRRVLLKQSKPLRGSLSRLLGKAEIELVQGTDMKPKKIFRDRYWGDLGFIHLCFDVQGMDALRNECAEKGFPFTVDSNIMPDGRSFDMGEAAGYFSYIEDPDGALIEFVETHKIPIVKKLGWYLDLRKRESGKPLPNYILKALKFNKVKDKYLE
jgi:catechol 2,3-dioxygenase-like lactoylglutathione lyase family enzyme